MKCFCSYGSYALRMVFIPCKLYYSGSPFYPGYPYGILGVSSDLEHQFCYFPVFVSPWKMDLWF